MSIVEQEGALFQEWEKSRPDLVRDGVVDEAAYLHSQPRVLLIMKEINGAKSKKWTLPSFLRHGGRPATWNNVTRWLLDLRSLSDGPSWPEVERICRRQRVETLKSLVVMNLKKSTGGATAVFAQVRDAALEDKAYLKRQFQLYGPDVVVCCGVNMGSLFRRAVMPSMSRSWNRTSDGVKFQAYSNGKVAVEFLHPQALGVRKQLIFNRFVAACRELEDLWNLGLHPTAGWAGRGRTQRFGGQAVEGGGY